METTNIPPNASLVPPSRRGGAFSVEARTSSGGGTPSEQPIRTMKSDMARAIEERNESLVSIALAEERKKATQLEAKRAQEKEKASVQDTSPVAPRPHGRFFLVVMLVVLAGLVGALGVVLWRVLPTIKISLPNISIPDFGLPNGTPSPNDPSPLVAPIVLVPSLIPANTEKKIDITGKSAELIFAEVVSEHLLGVEKGAIKNMYFTEEVKGEEGNMVSQTVRAERLLGLLDFRVPEMLTRALDDSFMVGFLGEETGATPFLVFKVASYEGGLAGILLWEKKLPFFFDTAFGSTSFATSSPQIVFRDVVIEGRDARTGELGSMRGISYAFVDDTTLIVAGSKSALEELLKKEKGSSR